MNSAPNTCWIQFINHANHKIIDLNVIDWANATKNTYSPIWQTLFSPLTSMRCTKTISPPGMASSRKSSLTPHGSMMEMCCSCFMDTKYKCMRCTHKMAFNSKSTPTSPNLQRTTYHFVQKRKIRMRSACESKTLKGSIHVFTQEGNQCGLSLLAFSYLHILKVSLNRFSL